MKNQEHVTYSLEKRQKQNQPKDETDVGISR